MVALREVRTANSLLKNKPTTQSLTAVFTGATNGIGKATLEAFAKHIPNPTAIIIGRSERAFAPHLQALKSLNPKGDFIFLEADISLLKNIDDTTKHILHALHGRQIDLLAMSQGYLPFNGRQNNAEGLDNSTSVRYYGRIRLTENLLPHLSPHARILSVLAGGQEGKIIEDDLDLGKEEGKNFSLSTANAHFTTATTLTFDHLAARNPDMAFLHVFPGLVSTGLLSRSGTGLLGLLFRWVVDPLMTLFAATPQDSGERMLHYVTREEFETGSWALDSDGTSKENDILKEYRQRNFADTIVQHNQAVFDRVLRN